MIRKTTDMKNHAVRSPVVMGIAGAILGTVAARLIRGATAKQRKERIEWQPADRAGWAAGAEGGDYEEYTADSAGLGDRVRDKAANLKDDVRDKASDLKERATGMVDDVKGKVDDVRERAMQTVSDVRERLPSTEQIRDSATDAYRFATEEQPALGGILAMGVGMALGFLIPVTEREERFVQPLKERAAENLGHLDDKVRQLADKLDEKIAGQQQSQGLTQTTEDREPQNNPFVASTSRPFPSA